MVIDRTLGTFLRTGKKSALLLGPRQTGKSTLIKQLRPELTINLADEAIYLAFASHPSELRERLAARRYRTVCIDEVQRLPSLLNTIQAIHDDLPHPPKFYLTGSSARKLRRGQANLLPGRIVTYQLGPLTARELDYDCHTLQAMATGTLPGIYLADPQERLEVLRSYSATYLREEIQAEALSRNVEGFSRFLFVAAQYSGHFLDLTALASEAQINRQSATRYFEILEDTLIVHRVPPLARTDRKRLLQHPKYYFFDTGVLNALLGNFTVSADRKGLLFEHLFINQLFAGAAAARQNIRVSSYRTQHGAEVDCIVEIGEKTWAIELKASHNIGPSDYRGLTQFSAWYRRPHHAMICYLGTAAKRSGTIDILPWQDALQRMGL